MIDIVVNNKFGNSRFEQLGDPVIVLQRRGKFIEAYYKGGLSRPARHVKKYVRADKD